MLSSNFRALMPAGSRTDGSSVSEYILLKYPVSTSRAAGRIGVSSTSSFAAMTSRLQSFGESKPWISYFFMDKSKKNVVRVGDEFEPKMHASGFNKE
jgi:hypothetical protein